MTNLFLSSLLLLISFTCLFSFQYSVNAISGSKRAAFFSPAVVASVALTVAFFKIKESKPGGGIFGPRDPLADEIFDQGQAIFKRDMAQIARARSISGDKAPTPIVGEPKLPSIVLYCAAAAAMGAFIFTCMTSMTALVWLALFNFGPTELGIFLTAIGFVSIFMNVVGVKFMVKKYGTSVTIVLAAILLDIGIAGYTFLETFWVQCIYFVLFINVGWSLTLPTLLSIAGDSVPPELRGKATGMIAGSMSLGFATCPLLSGALFKADILSIQHEYGKFSHLMFILGGVGMGGIQLCVLFYGIVFPQMKSEKEKNARDAAKRGQKIKSVAEA